MARSRYGPWQPIPSCEDVYPLEVHSLAFLSADQLLVGLNRSTIQRFNFKTGMLIETKKLHPQKGVVDKKKQDLKEIKILNSGDRIVVVRNNQAILLKTDDLMIIKIFDLVNRFLRR